MQFNRNPTNELRGGQKKKKVAYTVCYLSAFSPKATHSINKKQMILSPALRKENNQSHNYPPFSVSWKESFVPFSYKYTSLGVKIADKKRHEKKKKKKAYYCSKGTPFSQGKNKKESNIQHIYMLRISSQVVDWSGLQIFWCTIYFIIFLYGNLTLPYIYIYIYI